MRPTRVPAGTRRIQRAEPVSSTGPGIKATIRNVAKLAGVAPSTVSHYLNRTAQLAPETAQNVERAIAALDYRVNLGARSLRLKKTHSIGLIIPNINTPYFGELAGVIENVLWDRAYQMLLCISERDPERELSHLATLVSRQVDGILMVYNQERENRAERTKAPVPLVFLDRAVTGAPSVASDNYLGGKLAAEHLVSSGHRQIAILCGEPAIRNVADRLAGFNDVLARRGLRILPEHILEGLQDLELGSRVGELFAKRPYPTAIFATNDIVAIGAWCELIRRSFRVPADVSLIGFDDIQMSQFLVPPLTTVAQPAPQIGREAVELLIDLINRKDQFVNAAPAHVKVAPALKVRGSVGAPPRRR
ncbi:MAG: LacI family DNA-binding transcriptional regulator [Verrucomicrobia bacterium]|nr:LacI family DNA-binding transcriptional regulator [Verrucomicrobiota bacterium]